MSGGKRQQPTGERRSAPTSGGHTQDDEDFASAVPTHRYFLSGLATLMLAVAIPLVALQVIGLVRDKEAADKAVFAGLSARAEDAATSVDSVLTRTEQLLAFLSSREELKSLNVAPCNALLKGVVDIDPVYSNVVLVNTHGGLICSSIQGPAPKSFSDREWFVRGMSANGYALSDPVVGRIRGRQIALLTLPVLGGENERLGLLGVAIDLRLLATLLPGSGLPAQGTLAVVKDNAVFLTRTPDPQKWIGQPIPDEVRDKRMAVLSGIVIAKSADGVERAFAAAKPLRYGLHVSVGTPVAPLYARAASGIAEDVLLAALVVFWGVLVAYFGSRKLARPLDSIAATTRELAAGQSGARADESLPGEFGEVAVEFNRLMDHQERASAHLRHSERRALRSSNFYEALSSTNQAIVHLPQPNQLFAEVCRICVATELADMAWIGVIEGGVSRPVAWGGRAREYTEGLVIRVDESNVINPGLIAKAVHTGRPFTANRYLTDPSTVVWRERAARFNVRASAAFPFTCDGVVIGTLNLYVGEEDYFDEELVALLETMMRDISFALEAYKRKGARAAMLEAEAANRAKATFLSSVSHELRTPLNAILGFTQLLQLQTRDSLNERARLQLDNVFLAASQLAALIDDVMDVSRIEAGQLKLARKNVQLQRLLEGVIRLCEPMADKAGVALHADFAQAPLLRIDSDPVRLRQVVLNLVTNAIKYNRPGGSVVLTLRHTDERVALLVRDTGLGMSRDQLATLFQPFNRLGREHTSIEGTGIGLSLTRQLVELFGGTLDIQSEENVGTEVTVLLPYVEASSPSTEHGEMAEAHPVNAPSKPESPSGIVLYIEDNPVNVLLVEQLLSIWPDVKLVVAASGAQGIVDSMRLLPDVVLLDMNLPDMLGLDILRRLRADAATRSLRVIALSASVMPEDVAAAMDAGVDDYWTKPIDFAQVLQGLEQELRR